MMHVVLSILIALVTLVGCASTSATLPPGRYRFVGVDGAGKQIGGRINILHGDDQVFARGALCSNDGTVKVVAYDQAGTQVASYTCIRR
jgi:hypothetical protein